VEAAAPMYDKHQSKSLRFYQLMHRLQRGHSTNRLWTSFILPVENVPDSFQDEFLELKADSCARDLFNEKSITAFWPLMCDSYP